MSRRRNVASFDISTEDLNSDFNLETDNNNVELNATLEDDSQPVAFNISIENLNSEFALGIEGDDVELDTDLREGYGPTTIVDYDDDVIHKPQIEGVTLEGNKTFEELGLVIDDELSLESSNPVENQVITAAIQDITSHTPRVDVRTTAEWSAAIGFIPEKNTIIIYSDYETIEEGGEQVPVPNFKVADGLAYVQDLPFIDAALREMLIDHINNTNIHVSLAEKMFWNNKLNVTDTEEVVSGRLIFNRS